MRTFAFSTPDDREHRLLGFAGETPEPPAPEAIDFMETPDVSTPETPVEVVDTAQNLKVETTKDIDTTGVQISHAEQLPEDPAVLETPEVKLTAEQIQVAMKGAADFVDKAGNVVSDAADVIAGKMRQGADMLAKKGGNALAKNADSDLWTEMRAMGENPDSTQPLRQDATVSYSETKAGSGNGGYGEGYPDFAKEQGKIPQARPEAQVAMSQGGTVDNNDGYGPGYPEFAKRQGDLPVASKNGETYPVSVTSPEQTTVTDALGDTNVKTGTEGMQNEMLDVQTTLQDRVLNVFPKSFPGVHIDRNDMPNQYVLYSNKPDVMQKIIDQATRHGLHPEVSGDGTVVVTISGFEKGYGYVGPDTHKEGGAESEGLPGGRIEGANEGTGEGGALEKDSSEKPRRVELRPESKEKRESTEARESKETPKEHYEREKQQQLKSQETQKLADVRGGDPDQWSTIQNGKTDPQGNAFLYKEGTMTVDGQEQTVLLAYSPTTGAQVMDVDTGQWKLVSRMSPEEKKQLSGLEGMDQKEHAAAVTKEEKKDPAAFKQRMEQNERNLQLEEGCLKNGKADPEWFEAHKNDPFWKGNEDIRDALDAALNGQGKKTPETPKKNEPFEIAKTKPAEAPKTEPAEVAKTEPAEAPKETANEKTEKPTDKEIAAAGETLLNPNATAAQRQEAINTLTDAALAESKKTNANKDLPGDWREEKPKTDMKPVEKVKEREENKENDKELRGRLMAELRNTEPMKTVDGLKTEKTKAFDEQKTKSTEAIDAADQAVNTQRDLVQDLERQISDLEQEASGTVPDKRGPIEAKIAEVKAKQDKEKPKIQELETNRETLKTNLRKATDEHDKEMKTLDKMSDETVQRAQKAALKIDNLGTKLIGLGETEIGKIAQNITVIHDNSLGMLVVADAELVNRLDLVLTKEQQKQLELTKADNPALVLSALNGAIKIAEARVEQGKKKIV